jgi:NTP-dependent ternary system trypsin peptidase co-occuring protein
MFKTIAISALALLTVGCASQQSQPSKITLEDAMRSVGRGVSALKDAEGGMQMGMIPSEITVTFNITASAEDSSKIYLDLNPSVVKAGVEAGSKTSTTRGNQITIKLQHLFLLPKDSKPGADIDALVALIQKYHWVLAK